MKFFLLIKQDQEYYNYINHCHDFMNCYKEKEINYSINNEYIDLAYLYAIVWGDFSFAILSSSMDDRECLALGTLTNTISNDILAIVNLVLDGLDYQAMNIVRNLYEIMLLTLNICLDKNKRTEFVHSAEKDNSYEVWRKNFNVKSMLSTIANYSDNEELSFFWENTYKNY